MMKRPNKVKIMDIEYRIEYCDNPSNVDIYKRDSLWGQIDYWTRTIRVYDNGRSINDVWHTIWHEIIHGIVTALNLDIKDENAVDMLATGINSVVKDNKWIKFE